MSDTTLTARNGGLDIGGRLRRAVSQYWTTMVIVLLLLVAWEAFARITPRGNNYFPTIGHTIQQTMASSDLLLSSLQSTATATVLSFILAVVVGVGVGIVFSEFILVREIGMPVLIFGYALPAAILAPLFVIWFGIGLSGVVAFGAWVAVFPVFINTMTGMGQTDPEFFQLAEVYGASDWQVLKTIKFWKALPHISAGAKIAVQSSIVGVIVGEFIASGSGLGYLIVLAAQRAQLGFTYGTIVMLIIFAVTFFTVVTGLIEWVTPSVE